MRWKAAPVVRFVMAMALKMPGVPKNFPPSHASGKLITSKRITIIKNERLGSPIALNAEPQPGTRLPST